MTTTWLHVTSSYYWSRPAVGIIRVEQRLFAALCRQSEADIRYCVQIDGTLREITSEELNNRIAANVKHRPAPQSKSPIATAMLRLRGLAMRGLVTLARRNAGAKHLLERSRDARRHLQGGPTAVPPRTVADIRPGDTFVTVGLDWTMDYDSIHADIVAHKKAKLVTFCHDLIPVLYPEYCLPGNAAVMQRYFDSLLSRSDLVLCNSLCTQRDLIAHAAARGVPAPETVVVPLGCDMDATEDMSHPAHALATVTEPYILYVSTIERRKNHQVIHDVYAELAGHPACADLPAVYFIGMRGWRVNDLMDDIRMNEKISHKFHILLDVSDADLHRLHRDALFCVYPSYYEGWGLPVAEALAMGKAVIASDAGALPEAGGDCALYVSPYDTRGWRDAILRMSTDAAWRQTWEDKARNSYRPQDWDASAQIVIAALGLSARTTDPAMPSHPMAADHGKGDVVPPDAVALRRSDPQTAS